jgi:predicted RNase H-like HicB family nuclease
MRTFNVVVEARPDTGLYVGYVPGWPGTHSQGEGLDELRRIFKKSLQCSSSMASRN